MRAARHEAGHPVERQRVGTRRHDDVAEPAALEHSRLGENRDIGEDVLQRGGLAAGEGEAGAVGDVDGDDAPGGQEGAQLLVELDTRDVGGNARTAEHVDHDDVDRAAQSGRQPRERRSSIPVAQPDARLPGKGQVLAHEAHELLVELDDLLARTGARGVDVAGQGERTRPEMHGGERLAGVSPLVDDVADALHVLEEQAARVVEVDVRLRRAVHDELVAAGVPAVQLDAREKAARQAHLDCPRIARAHHARKRGTSPFRSPSEGI